MTFRLTSYTLAAALLAFAVNASTDLDSDFDTTDYVETDTIRRPSILHRPAKATPAEQLEYANTLAAAGATRKAAKAYLALVHQWHTSEEAPTAQRAFAEQMEKRGRHVRAFDEYQYLIDNFAGRFPYEEIIDRQFRIAHMLMTRPHGRVRRFFRYTSRRDVLPLFEQIVANAPSWKRTPEAQFNVALLHEAEREYKSAIAAYEVVTNRYNESDLHAAAWFRRAYCLYKLAGVNRRGETSCRNAMAALAGFLRDYPADPNAAAARKHLAELRERLATRYFERAEFYDLRNKARAASIAYSDFLRQFPSSSQAPAARARLEALKPVMEAADE